MNPSTLRVLGLLATLAKCDTASGDVVRLDRTATHDVLRNVLGDVGRNGFYTEVTNLAALADDLAEDAHALACDAARESGDDMPTKVAPVLSLEPYRGRGGNRLAVVMSTAPTGWSALGAAVVKALSESNGVLNARRVNATNAAIVKARSAVEDLDISAAILAPALVTASAIRPPARTAESACDAHPSATCTKCGETKSRDDFRERLAKVNGLDSLCAVCRQAAVNRSRFAPRTPEAIARAARAADRSASRRRGEAKAVARVLAVLTNANRPLHLGGIMRGLPNHATLARTLPILQALDAQGLIVVTRPTAGLTSYAVA